MASVFNFRCSGTSRLPQFQWPRTGPTRTLYFGELVIGQSQISGSGPPLPAGQGFPIGRKGQQPAGLMDKPRGGPKGSRLPELTKRTIVMLKEANPTWGCQKISDMLVRGPALPASASVTGIIEVS
jgi:hypothetical protein